LPADHVAETARRPRCTIFETRAHYVSIIRTRSFAGFALGASFGSVGTLARAAPPQRSRQEQPENAD
jgi:hypothetical protein